MSGKHDHNGGCVNQECKKFDANLKENAVILERTGKVCARHTLDQEDQVKKQWHGDVCWNEGEDYIAFRPVKHSRVYDTKGALVGVVTGKKDLVIPGPRRGKSLPLWWKHKVAVFKPIDATVLRSGDSLKYRDIFGGSSESCVTMSDCDGYHIWYRNSVDIVRPSVAYTPLKFHSTDGWFNIFGFLKGKAPLHNGNKDNNINAEEFNDLKQTFSDGTWQLRKQKNIVVPRQHLSSAMMALGSPVVEGDIAYINNVMRQFTKDPRFGRVISLIKMNESIPNYYKPNIPDTNTYGINVYGEVLILVDQKRRIFGKGDCGKVFSYGDGESQFTTMVSAGAYHDGASNIIELVRVGIESACCYVDKTMENYKIIGDIIKTGLEDRNQRVGAFFNNYVVVPRGKYPISLFPQGYNLKVRPFYRHDMNFNLNFSTKIECREYREVTIQYVNNKKNANGTIDDRIEMTDILGVEEPKLEIIEEKVTIEMPTRIQTRENASVPTTEGAYKTAFQEMINRGYSRSKAAIMAEYLDDYRLPEETATVSVKVTRPDDIRSSAISTAAYNNVDRVTLTMRSENFKTCLVRVDDRWFYMARPEMTVTIIEGEVYYNDTEPKQQRPKTNNVSDPEQPSTSGGIIANVAESVMNYVNPPPATKKIDDKRLKQQPASLLKQKSRRSRREVLSKINTADNQTRRLNRSVSRTRQLVRTLSRNRSNPKAVDELTGRLTEELTRLSIDTQRTSSTVERLNATIVNEYNSNREQGKIKTPRAVSQYRSRSTQRAETTRERSISRSRNTQQTRTNNRSGYSNRNYNNGYVRYSKTTDIKLIMLSFLFLISILAIRSVSAYKYENALKKSGQSCSWRMDTDRDLSVLVTDCMKGVILRGERCDFVTSCILVKCECHSQEHWARDTCGDRHQRAIPKRYGGPAQHENSYVGPQINIAMARVHYMYDLLRNNRTNLGICVRIGPEAGQVNAMYFDSKIDYENRTGYSDLFVKVVDFSGVDKTSERIKRSLTTEKEEALSVELKKLIEGVKNSEESDNAKVYIKYQIESIERDVVSLNNEMDYLYSEKRRLRESQLQLKKNYWKKLYNTTHKLVKEYLEKNFNKSEYSNVEALIKTTRTK